MLHLQVMQRCLRVLIYSFAPHERQNLYTDTSIFHANSIKFMTEFDIQINGINLIIIRYKFM